MKRGFTLVELSIVLVIIGLLIGGVLAAQSMISTTRLQSITRELSQYDIAMRNFKERFRFPPGDMPNAYDYFGTACGNGGLRGGVPFQEAGCNGNGNGLIEGCCHPAESDNIILHMSLAGVLPTTYTNLQDDQAYIPGKNVPKGPYKNTFYRFWGGSSSATAYYVVIQNLDAANPRSTSNNGDATAETMKAITPADAMALDKKLDDGMPFTGNVSVVGYIGFTNCLDGANNYNGAVSARVCSIQIFYPADSYY